MNTSIWQIEDQNHVVHVGNYVIELRSATREVYLSAATEQERILWVNAIRSAQSESDASKYDARGSGNGGVGGAGATALLRNLSDSSMLQSMTIPVLMAHNRRFGHPNRFSRDRKDERKRQRLPKMKKTFSDLWLDDVLSQTTGKHDAALVEALCFAGIPKEVRGRAWAWILGNKLQVNEDLFKICKARALAVRREMELKRDAARTDRIRAEQFQFQYHHQQQQRAPSIASLVSSSTSCSASSPVTLNSSSECDFGVGVVVEEENNSDARDSAAHAPVVSVTAVTSPVAPTIDETQSMMLQEAVSIAEMLVAHGERSIRLVNVDMPRTFGHHPLFQPGADGTERTTEVLEAYICYRPDLGYVQGMSYLAAALCFHMDSFTAFKALVSLMSTSLLFDMFRLEEKRVRPERRDPLTAWRQSRDSLSCVG